VAKDDPQIGDMVAFKLAGAGHDVLRVATASAPMPSSST
jgi:hypothetical protein